MNAGSTESHIDHEAAAEVQTTTTRQSPSSPPRTLERWLLGAALQVILIIGFFTLSTGKRADYIAAAFAPGALLAAWWLLRAPPFIARRHPILLPGAAAVTLLIVTAINQRQPSAPFPEYGQYMKQFIDESAEILGRDRLPVAFCFTGQTHVQAMLGYSVRDDTVRLDRLLRTGRPFWVVAGRRGPHRDFPEWLRQRTNLPLRIRPHANSLPLAWRGEMVEQFTLYRVDIRRRGGGRSRQSRIHLLRYAGRDMPSSSAIWLCE